MGATRPDTNADELRPTTWDGFIGQSKLKDRLQIHIQAAILDDRPLDHALLTGPPGFGKTTLSQIIATEMRDDCWTILASKSLGDDLWDLIRDPDFTGGIVFIDEIHRAPTSQQEVLLPVMDFGVLHTKRGPFEVESTTIVAATTEPQKLIAPLYDRFESSICPTFEEYSDEEMAQIVSGMAKMAGVKLPKDIATAFGRAAGGVPRAARKLVLAYRDLARVRNEAPSADDVLDMLRVDRDGLTANHKAYLSALRDLRGACGLGRLASMLRLNEAVLVNLERLLINKQLVTISNTGRELTPAGFRAIK